MKIVLRDALVAWSLGNLCFFRYWYHATRFFNRATSGSFAPIYGTISVPPGAILGLVCASLITSGFIFLLLWMGRKRATTKSVLLAHLALIPFLFLSANNLRLAIGDYRLSLGFLLNHAGYFFSGLCGVLVVAVAIYLLKKHERLVIHLIRAPAVLAAPFCLFYVGQGTYLIAHNHQARRSEGTPTHGKFRVVVLLFDRIGARELEIFPQAAVTKFKEEATEFMNAYPPAAYTAASVPAILMGEQSISPLRHLGDRKFEFTGCGQQNIEWRESRSIVGRAAARNLASKVIGWYLPYTAMFARSASSVIRFPHYSEVRHRFPDQFLPNLLLLAKELWLITPQMLPYHVDNFVALESLARSAAADANNDLVFIHYPIPHHPVIFDKASRQISSVQPYDAPADSNYMLMNQVLESTFNEMRSTGVYEKTAIILTADHAIYEASGREDHRIPFLLKLPGRHEPKQIAGSFNSLFTADLVEGLLSERFTDESTLEQWSDSLREESQAANACFLSALKSDRQRAAAASPQ